MNRRISSSLIGALLIIGLVSTVASARPLDSTRLGAATTRSPYAFFLQHGYMVGDVAHYLAVKQAAAQAYGVPTGTASGRTASAQAPLIHPAAIQNFQGAYDTSGDPPDTTGAAGPRSYVEAVNSKIAIFTKTGTEVSEATFDAALGPCQSSAAVCEYSDPQVLYDVGTHRFYYEDLNADIGGTDNFFVWGFSKTSNPSTFSSADWCNYTADFGYGANLPDYPKMGQNTDFLMLGVNVYAGEAYQGSDLDTITKPQGSAPISTCPDQSSFKLTKTSQIPDCNPQGVFAANLNPAQQADPKRPG